MSVRSGAKFSMPGMMNTILNLGLNDETTEGLIQLTGNPRFAYDCYRRFIQMFGEVALGIEMEKFDHVFDSRKAKMKAKLDTDLTAADLQAIIADYKKIVKKQTGKDFPQDPWEQLTLSRDAVFRSWWADKACYYRKMEKIPDELGTAANIQAMVFGNMGETSGTGVGFTRDPGTGEKVFYGEFLINAQGEDVVAGIRTPQPIEELKTVLPEAYKQLFEITQKLEQRLQGRAGLRVHHRRKARCTCCRPATVSAPVRRRFALQWRCATKASSTRRPLCCAWSRSSSISCCTRCSTLLRCARLPKIAKGIAASPGAAVGRVAFSADDAVTMSAKAPIILLRKETTPDDIHGMDVAKGILTAVGGASSHAAVVARGMGRPCIAGASAIVINEHTKTAVVTTKEGKKFTIKEGDWLSLDGGAGEVYLGQAKTQDPDPNSPIFSKFMGWADEFRGNFGVRANADIPRDAKAARAFGAEGIGLCRTEHMFFAEDRLPFVQAMILARDEKSRRKALQKLLPMQSKDFAGLFKAMNGFPVVIRTLDPPLHEFLPKRENLMVDLAQAAVRRHQSQARDGGALQHRCEVAEDASAGVVGARGRTARVQPDAWTSRLPSRHHVSRRSPKCRREQSSKRLQRCIRRASR